MVCKEGCRSRVSGDQERRRKTEPPKEGRLTWSMAALADGFAVAARSKAAKTADDI
jgi:hypothetical protein